MSREEVAGMVNTACLMLQWALDAYDFHFVRARILPLSCSQVLIETKKVFEYASSFFICDTLCLVVVTAQGARHELTMGAAREFAMSLLLLVEFTNDDACGTILQRGVEIVYQTLQVTRQKIPDY